VASGTPEEVAVVKSSFTGQFLREELARVKSPKKPARKAKAVA
jgi:excinuclease UvrABC ATPase subunit